MRPSRERLPQSPRWPSIPRGQFRRFPLDVLALRPLASMLDLTPAKLGQSLSVVVRMLALIVPTSRHGLSLSLQVQCFSLRMSHVSNMRVQITSNHHAASRRCGMHHRFCPIIQLVCRPVSEWWRIDPNQQEVQLRRFYPCGTSPALYASLWRGHFTEFARFRKCPV